MPHVLVVEDDPVVADLVAFRLQRLGLAVTVETDGETGLAAARRLRPDLVVLDWLMPRMDGLEVCKRLRAKGSTVPIIMLTAKSEEIDKVLGLELGADDYITKPFSVREFRSRVRAALRRVEMLRGGGAPDEPVVAGELRIDFERRSVAVRDAPVRLTYVEFEILTALASAPGRVLTREMLLEKVWGDSAYRDPRTIDVHIRHLREKLELDPREPEYLFTVRGVGYRFRDQE